MISDVTSIVPHSLFCSWAFAVAPDAAAVRILSCLLSGRGLELQWESGLPPSHTILSLRSLRTIPLARTIGMFRLIRRCFLFLEAHVQLLEGLKMSKCIQAKASISWRRDDRPRRWFTL
jgi:hypothetical protein